MGQFNSGSWLIGLSLYFAMYWFVVTLILQSASYYPDMDTSGVYTSDINILLAEKAGGYCYDLDFNPDRINLCSEYTSEDACNISSPCGCSWDGSDCVGGFLSGCLVDEAIVKYNETLCKNINYIWSSNTSGYADASVSSSGYNWKNVLDTFLAMGGFSGGIGVPAGIWTPFIYMILFWIPLIMFIWALYMAIPFIH